MAAIRWDAPAELRQVGVEEVVRGDLRACVAAFAGLPDGDRAGAMVLCDELVDLADGRPATKSLEGEDLARLAERLPA